MKQDFLFKNLIETLQDRIPQRGQLAEVLTEVLGIEKEAVYRRLRGSVPFSFQEIHTIALHFGLSLDSIAENVSPNSRQLQVITVELSEPQEKYFKRIEDFTTSIDSLKDDPDSESGAIGSIIPSSICVNYEYIYKFYILQWVHQFGNLQTMQTYAEISVPERLQQLNRDFIESLRNTPKSVYIFDRSFIKYFINDVRFFYDIRQLSKEDVLLLKEELHLLIDDLERYANKGCFETGNKVEIYLANVHIDGNYNYIDASSFKLTMIRSFAFTDSYSYDEAVFRNMKIWLDFLKRTSTLISEGNMAERIRFFEEQRGLVDSMVL